MSITHTNLLIEFPQGKSAQGQTPTSMGQSSWACFLKEASIWLLSNSPFIFRFFLDLPKHHRALSQDGPTTETNGPRLQTPHSGLPEHSVLWCRFRKCFPVSSSCETICIPRSPAVSLEQSVECMTPSTLWLNAPHTQRVSLICPLSLALLVTRICIGTPQRTSSLWYSDSPKGIL